MVLQYQACKSIAWFYSLQCKLNGAVQMFLVGPCDGNFIYMGIRTGQNMESGNGYYLDTMNTRLVSLTISCIGMFPGEEIRASVDII